MSTNPAGYDALVDQVSEERISGERGVMYGFAPVAYNLADGRQVVVDLDRDSLTSGRLLFAMDIGFEVGFATSSESPRLRCETRPNGPTDLEVRFGCWNADASIQYWVGIGEECSDRRLGAVETSQRPECWEGVLAVEDEMYTVAFGQFGRNEWVLNRVAWTDADGTIVQAANLVAKHSVQVHSAAELPEEHRDAITLHALALHQWIHLQDPE